LHDRDVTVDVLSSGAAENVRTSDESTIGVDELGFRESRLDHNGAAAIASDNAGEVIADLVMADLLTTLECHTRLRLEVTVISVICYRVRRSRKCAQLKQLFIRMAKHGPV
jgi:hypothetical protein